MRKLLLISMLAWLAMSTVAFAQAPSANTPPASPNFSATVVYPPGGNFIYGGNFVLTSPITPNVGGPNPNTPAPGVGSPNAVCEIGDECFVIPPIIAAVGAADATILLYEIIRAERSERSRFPPVSP
jgi:hypothetical protein